MASTKTLHFYMEEDLLCEYPYSHLFSTLSSFLQLDSTEILDDVVDELVERVSYQEETISGCSGPGHTLSSVLIDLAVQIPYTNHVLMEKAVDVLVGVLEALPSRFKDYQAFNYEVMETRCYNYTEEGYISFYTFLAFAYRRMYPAEGGDVEIRDAVRELRGAFEEGTTRYTEEVGWETRVMAAASFVKIYGEALWSVVLSGQEDSSWWAGEEYLKSKREKWWRRAGDSRVVRCLKRLFGWRERRAEVRLTLVRWVFWRESFLECGLGEHVEMDFRKLCLQAVARMEELKRGCEMEEKGCDEKV